MVKKDPPPARRNCISEIKGLFPSKEIREFNEKYPEVLRFIKVSAVVVLIITLLEGTSFLLNEHDIYPDNPYDRIKTGAIGLIDDYTPFSINKVKITRQTGRWISSRYGQIYLVSGKVRNNSNDLVSFIKLRVTYTLEDLAIHSREVWAGNSFSDWEIRNRSWSRIKARMQNRKGQIGFGEKRAAISGMNVNITPDEEVPFVSVYRPPDGDKVLGLKYRVEITGYELSER